MSISLFWVTDYSLNGEINEDVTDLKNLTSDERLKNILEKQITMVILEKN